MQRLDTCSPLKLRSIQALEDELNASTERALKALQAKRVIFPDLNNILTTWSGGRVHQRSKWHRAVSVLEFGTELCLEFYLADGDSIRDFIEVLEAFEDTFPQFYFTGSTDRPGTYMRTFCYASKEPRLHLYFEVYFKHARTCVLVPTGKVEPGKEIMAIECY